MRRPREEKKGHQGGEGTGWERRGFHVPSHGTPASTKGSPLPEGRGFSAFYRRLSQKSFVFTDSPKKQARALVHSSSGGFGGRRVEAPPDSAAEGRGVAVSGVLCGGGSQAAAAGTRRGVGSGMEHNGCQRDTARTLKMWRPGSSRRQTLCECGGGQAAPFAPLSLKPGHFHKWRVPNNEQIPKNCREASFSAPHPWGFGRTLNLYTHPSVTEPAVAHILLSHRNFAFRLLP